MKKSLFIMIFILAVMQLFRPDLTNPKVSLQDDIKAPSDVKSILKRSCYDCHSFETNYPWYTNISPISWYINRHIDDGRKWVNFSIWETYNRDKQDELKMAIAKSIRGAMPIDAYTQQHPKARLSTQDKQILRQYLGVQY